MLQLNSDLSLYANGEWKRAAGSPIEVRNPATEVAISSVASADGGDVARAVESARRVQPEWERTPAPSRSSHLRALSQLLVDNTAALARLIMEEVGKPLAAAEEEVAGAAAYAQYMAEWDRRIEGEVVPSDAPDETILICRVAMGVVGAITAWNYPVELYVRKVAPALLTGNTVVLKPSELAPLSSLALTELIHDRLDLPPGVLNVVTGGPSTGEELARSEGIDLITMTGSRAAGRRVMALASEHVTKVSLELGGKAPALVLPDAPLDQVVEQVISARHTNSGQVCTCVERVLVHDDVFDEFVERYVDGTRALRMGDPLGDVDLGPLISSRHRDRVRDAVELAEQQGAEVLTGGSPPAREGVFATGYWFEPTVLGNVSAGMEVMTEEIFGPVTPIQSVRSLSEAVEQANASPYGLSAYIYTSDYGTAMRAVEALKFGEVYVNRPMGEALQAHHGGFRESGIGGEDGRHGVLTYTQPKSVYHRYSPA